jgi:Uma2 family endonuclease
MSTTTATAPAPAADWSIPRRHWTREEFHRASDLGVFRPGERLELIAGELVEKMTQNRPHAIGVSKTAEALERAFGAGFYAQEQQPLALATDGEPEPDVLMLRGAPDDYPDHPTEYDALLVVEISDTTLAYDRGRKAAYYAEAGIADYWIVNLGERQVEVLRQPAADPTSPWGHSYQSRTVVAETGTLSPLAAPAAVVRAADLLPSQ